MTPIGDDEKHCNNDINHDECHRSNNDLTFVENYLDGALMQTK